MSRIVHCWAEGPFMRRLGKPDCGSTCLLPVGHKGGHIWTPDDQILIDFTGGQQ
jgi:hypothetical protein